MRKLAMIFGVLGVLFTGAASALEESNGEPIPVAITVGGVIIHGEIVAYNDDGMSFKLRDTGDVLSLPWSSLQEIERDRLRGIVGLRNKAPEPEIALSGDGADGALPDRERYRGKKVWIVELSFHDSFRKLRGIELTERETGDAIFIKTRTTPQFRIRKKDIKEKKHIEDIDRNYYSPLELYRRRKEEINPTTARDEFVLGTFSYDVGLFVRARHHYRRAEILDPAYADRIKPLMEKIQKEIAREEAKSIYMKFQNARARRQWDRALEKLEELEMAYVDSDWYTRAAQQKEGIEAKRLAALQKKVITEYYRVFDQLVSRTVHKRVTDGEDIPGKIVSTRGHQSFMGVLVDDNEEEIVLQEWLSKEHIKGPKVIRIAKGEVLHVVNTNLNKNKRMRTFEESKAYVTDKEGGITADIQTAIARRYHVAEEEVKEIWEKRLAKEVIVSRNSVKSNKLMTSLREANYGKGSWLREGVKLVQNTQSSNRNKNLGPRQRRQQRLRQQQQKQRKKSKDESTDPEVWWRGQTFSTRQMVLKAIGAEALFHVVRRGNVRCPVCGGSGGQNIYGTTGGTSVKTCPHCRGLRFLTKLTFQ